MTTDEQSPQSGYVADDGDIRNESDSEMMSGGAHPMPWLALEFEAPRDHHATLDEEQPTSIPEEERARTGTCRHPTGVLRGYIGLQDQA